MSPFDDLRYEGPTDPNEKRGVPLPKPTVDAHPFMWNKDVIRKATAELDAILGATKPLPKPIARDEPVSVDDVISEHCGPFTYRPCGDDEILAYDINPNTWELTKVSHTLNGEPVPD